MSRRGYTLTELLVVMGMTSVIMTAALGMVHHIIDAQKMAEHDQLTHLVAVRLTTQLRRDVYFALEAELIPFGDGAEQKLVLTHPDEKVVEYVVHRNVLQRTTARSSEITHRDSFQFPEHSLLQFSDVSNDHVTFEASTSPPEYLSIDDDASSEGRNEDALRTVVHVKAAVRRDHRFQIEKKESQP